MVGWTLQSKTPGWPTYRTDSCSYLLCSALWNAIASYLVIASRLYFRSELDKPLPDDRNISRPMF